MDELSDYGFAFRPPDLQPGPAAALWARSSAQVREWWHAEQITAVTYAALQATINGAYARGEA